MYLFVWAYMNRKQITFWPKSFIQTQYANQFAYGGYQYSRRDRNTLTHTHTHTLTLTHKSIHNSINCKLLLKLRFHRSFVILKTVIGEAVKVSHFVNLTKN